ncbi:hypothetical protein AK812_SmicGene23436 [Symbiodinium microadriaticum]|uniref:Uncharacterized protein n=1 Tax=Symbiodinium microadriaticum TaxID=2951 RepID=A0A1Q9DH58_SYMMI|nr:hypothetical protein AK812_SmicGene23436 [Symbiodinium microadriaticum]CAE7944235.1 unnamed protein product [Symbiodinium sp. KB8]
MFQPPWYSLLHGCWLGCAMPAKSSRDDLEAPRPAPQAMDQPHRGEPRLGCAMPCASETGPTMPGRAQAEQLSGQELCGGLAAGNVVQQDAIPLTAELEELIDKTISEIQELESQERLFLLQESDSSQDARAELRQNFSKVDVPSPPQIPRAKRPVTTGAREAEVEAVEHCRRFLAQACRPQVKIRTPYAVPKFDLTDVELRHPFEKSLESMSFDPLQFRILRRSAW